MTADCDIVIVGGGLVGASLACALSALPLRIVVVEAVPLRAQEQPSYDDRAIALAYGSRVMFDALGLWSALAQRVALIEHIHISDRGHFGVARLHSRDEGVEALGYVVENRVMGAVLADALAGFGNVELVSPARLMSIELDADAARVCFDHNGVVRELAAQLVIGADGGQSAVRGLLQIPVRTWDYGQSAITANVSPARFHTRTAYERFTPTGPVAMLPNAPPGTGDNHRCSLVWTVRRDEEQPLLALSDEAFLARLQGWFGHRLGRIEKVGRRGSYPLKLIRAKEQVRPRLALIGNAAHTLHPVAGQGFNLGLRDVAVLAQVLAEGVAQGRDIGEAAVLRRYADWRLWDQRRAIGFTDGLARVFSNPLPPVALGRNLGLLAVDLVPPFRRLLTRQTMGLAGRLPRLALGLPLVEDV